MSSDDDSGLLSGLSNLPVPDLTQGLRVHFVGIGGIGMAAMAQYLLARGMRVSGSDINGSITIDTLRSHGAKIVIGHREKNVEGADLVVITAAAPTANLEVVSALRLDIPLVKRADLLGHITAGGRTVAVAGTHGKSTTTAMIAHLLRQAGIDATLFGGAHLRTPDDGLEGPGWGKSADTFVVEADEYDRSFLQLHPSVAVITGIEFDHPDCYGTLDDMTEAYSQFSRQVSDLVIVNSGSNLAITAADPPTVPVETYGFGLSDDWAAQAVQHTSEGARFELHRSGRRVGEASIDLPGIHNVENAVAAISAAAGAFSLDPEILVGGLATFRGVARRLETRGIANGVTVVDDYAHHPTEIRAAARSLAGDAGRLRVIFQPHTFSRVAALMDEFVQVLSEIDEVLLLDIYPAREAPIEGVNSERLASLLRAQGGNAQWFSDNSAAIEYLARTSLVGDIVVTMGAGDVTDLAPQILLALSATQSHEARSPATRPRHSQAEPAAARIVQALSDAGLTRVRTSEPLSRHTSWRIGGPADYFAVAESAAGLQSAMRIAHENDIPCLVLGAGSNILVSDDGVTGLVLLNRIRSLDVHADNVPNVEAGSGVFFARLATFTARAGWAGLEWGVAIPGTVGAGVVNNAGAHDGDVAHSLVSAELVDVTGSVRILNRDAMDFNYRSSVLKRPSGVPVTESPLVVCRAWFRVTPDSEGRSLALIDELMARRMATQPISEPSGGSTFKNPPEGSAGRLIEQAGLKGFRIGDAEISTKHANFVLNRGRATGAEIVQLIRHAQNVVSSRLGIQIEPEIQLIGRWSSSTVLTCDPVQEHAQ